MVASAEHDLYVQRRSGGQRADGKNGLVAIIDSGRGDTRCIARGKGIYTGVGVGVGVDGDGLVQATEAQGSTFVCNGADRANGSSSLLAMVEESPEEAVRTEGGACRQASTRTRAERSERAARPEMAAPVAMARCGSST